MAFPGGSCQQPSRATGFRKTIHSWWAVDLTVQGRQGCVLFCELPEGFLERQSALGRAWRTLADEHLGVSTQRVAAQCRCNAGEKALGIRPIHEERDLGWPVVKAVVHANALPFDD